MARFLIKNGDFCILIRPMKGNIDLAKDKLNKNRLI